MARIQVALIPAGEKKIQESELPVDRTLGKDNRKRGRKAKTRKERNLVKAVRRTEHDNYKEL